MNKSSIIAIISSIAILAGATPALGQSLPCATLSECLSSQAPQSPAAVLKNLTGLRLGMSTRTSETQPTITPTNTLHLEQLLDHPNTEQTLEHRASGGGWIRPVSGRVGYLTSGQRFGAYRTGNRPGECGLGHCGVDLARNIGTPVNAASKGVVVFINRARNSKAGLWVEIAHEGGRLSSRYLHLNAIRPGLRIGDIVHTGERIGDVGDTGTSSHGAHLHFELYENHNNGQRRYINPTDFLRSLESHQH